MAKIKDLTLLSDIFPTGYHGAVTAGVGPGSIVYVAGAGPVGLACAAACQLLGAAVVIVGDMIPERLAQAKSFGCETVDLRKDASLGDQIAQIIGVPEVDCAVDCVGFEARGHGTGRRRGASRHGAEFADDDHPRRRRHRHSRPLCHRRSRRCGRERQDRQSRASASAWAGRSRTTFTTGQCPVMRYHRQLMQCILHDKIQIAKAVNVTMISLDEAPQGYKDFDKGAAKKYVIDPHHMVAAA